MPRIVCIDPDAGRAEEPVKLLRSAGYDVMMACTPDVGLALLRLFPPDIVLLCSELADKLTPQIHMACPTVPVVLTGNKPVSADELRWLTAHRQSVSAAPQRRHLTH